MNKTPNESTDMEKAAWFRFSPGIWIILGIMVLLTARVAWHRLHHPRNFEKPARAVSSAKALREEPVVSHTGTLIDFEKLARGFSSINAFREGPVVNHAGTLIGMIHNTPQGTGVFIANTADKTEQTICEMKDVDDVGDPNVLGWSPDDGTFAYRWNVALCFVGTNGTTCPGEIPTPDLDSFVWLSPASCAYIDADTNHDNVPQIAVAQNIHGTWQETTSWPLPTAKGKPHSLLAMGTNTVAWQAGNAIWQMNLASGKIESVYANPEGSIDSVSYSEESGKFLILETAKASSRRRLPALFALLNGSKIPETSSKLSMRDTRLINQGRGYVFLHPEGENMSLIIQPGGGEAEETFFQSGRVEDFFCDGESSRVYALASKTNEAPSIWLCDAAAGNAQCLYSPWGFAAVPLHFQTASVHYVELPGKHHEKFVLIPPANFSPDKKYPLIIGMQSYDWMNVPHATYSQALANSGDYVALTDYHYTHQTEEALLHYTNNVLAVYNDLLKNPNVDRSQVYLFAFSSSTIVVNHLIDDYPGRWRGVMLFNPTADLPMPKSGGFPPILATAGSDEEWLYKQFPSYQETLAKEGLSMEWYVHPDEGHIERSQNVMYKRALLMENMVLGN